MKLYIDDLLLHGKKLYNINIGDYVNEILKRKDFNFKLFGDNRNGYYYLPNGYRFGFSNNIVDEIGIDFNNTNCVISITSIDKKDFDINSKKIHEILNLLNDLELSWQAIPNRDNNYLMIQLTDTSIVLIFDIYEGSLDKIAISKLKVK